MTRHSASMLLILSLLAGLQSAAAQGQPAARTFFGCVNSELYVCPEIDSSVVCYHTTNSCSGSANWVVAVGRAKLPDHPGFTHTPGVPAGIAAEVFKLARELKASDIRSYYRTNDAVQTAFLRRTGSSSLGTVTISDQQMSPWLLSGLPSSNLSEAARGVCPGNLYPNPKKGGGTNCYPCLGCTPCGASFCSVTRIALTPADLSPALAQEGYTVHNGKLSPPQKLKPVESKSESFLLRPGPLEKCGNKPTP